MPTEFDVPAFSACSGDTFRVRTGPGETVDVTLDVVTASPGPAHAGWPAGRDQPFTLLFRGPLSPLLPQKIHTFEHETLGTVEIFIVPIGPDSEGHRYKAIFN